MLFVGAFWYWVPRLIVPVYYTANIENQGAFGDTYGSVNALFTGLAFAGLIITLILQMKELRLQREELESTREELEGQKVQLANQSEALQTQGFENTFFQLSGVVISRLERLEHHHHLDAIIATFLKDILGHAIHLDEPNSIPFLEKAQEESKENKATFITQLLDKIFSDPH